MGGEVSPEPAAGAPAEVRAVLLLSGLPGVGERTLVGLVDHFGSGEAALSAPHGAFCEVAGPRAARARREPGRRRAVEEILDRCAAVDARVVAYGTAGYPESVAVIHDPPPVLFLRGDRALLDLPAVTVVGSRRATGYGRRMAGRVAAALSRAGVVVVSGLALGIDAAAHRGALDAGGRTVAVLGAGVDVPHPAANARLFEILARDHLLVSEFRPGEQPLPHHFPQRNRILAALSRAVVVVEAARKSGALITVGHALDLGRDVLALPGPVDRPTSRGTNALLRDGAGVLTSPEAVTGLLSWIPGLEGAGEGDLVDRTAGPPPALGARAREVWDALADGVRTPDQVARLVRAPTADILSTLSLMEMDGWVVRRAGMRFARREKGAS